MMNWFCHIRSYLVTRPEQRIHLVHFLAWIIFPNILFAFYASYLVFRHLQIDLSLRAFISIYLIWLLPSALISIIRDDISRERSRLSKEVSREIRIQNPQAAVENAFTHFEDHLFKRISGSSNLWRNIKNSLSARTVDPRKVGFPVLQIADQDLLDRQA